MGLSISGKTTDIVDAYRQCPALAAAEFRPPRALPAATGEPA
jgi:hypothetical protein